jgi:pimeloyl-ACP methyl ester carboxylesterase
VNDAPLAYPSVPLAYAARPVVPGVRSRFIDNGNGLSMHVLESGWEPGRAGASSRERPCVLLLHGFPELAYSWRYILPALANAGYHAVAPDQRGCGQTTGWANEYDTDLQPFGMLNRVTDLLGLVGVIGRESVAAVVGHDVGSGVAAWCGLTRPDVFRSVVLSGPFAPPRATSGEPIEPDRSVDDELAGLDPPRKHYKGYFSTRSANLDMWRCSQGVHAFLRGYYHAKSADWEANRPFALSSARAEELAQLPEYYVMLKDRSMPQTVSAMMPSADHTDRCIWLPERELRVYSGEYERTGFQGGLQHYRCLTSPECQAEHARYPGVTLDAPSCIIAGDRDWGYFMQPGLVEAIPAKCRDLRGCYRIPGAGHWVQQEAPPEYAEHLLSFLREVAPT